MKTITKIIRIVFIMLGCTILMSTTCVVETDIAQFLLNPIPRFEGAGKTTIINTDASYIFYSDKGGLFSSSKNKVGYSSRDGSSFCFVEWSGDYYVGSKSSPTLRTQNGEVSLQYLEVVQYQGGTIWIVYKQSATSSEGKIVQKW